MTHPTSSNFDLQAAARQEETARLRAEVEELRRELAALRGEGK